MSDKPFHFKQAVIAIIVMLIGISSAGCDLIGGIFKAGLWVGVILVLLIVGAVGIVMWLLRGRT